MSKAKVEVWAETIGEAVSFLKDILPYTKGIVVDRILVAKRAIGKGYLLGRYREFSTRDQDTLQGEVQAPSSVVDLVQWQTPDLIMSLEGQAFLAVESTSHLPTWNNVAQRFPRLLRAASLKVPNVISQLVHRGMPTREVTWIAEFFRRTGLIYDTPSIFLPYSTQIGARKTHAEIARLCSTGAIDKTLFYQELRKISSAMLQIAGSYDQQGLEFGSRSIRRNWLRVTPQTMEILIGVNPNAGMWKTKGTGGLDPYPGLIKMGEILAAYSPSLKKERSVQVRFVELPEDFWWFKKNPDELYYRLIKEFSEQLIYKGQQLLSNTQSAAVIAAKKLLSSGGWTILYDDLPGSSRSGIGDRQLIAQFFQGELSQIPDLLIARGEKLLLLECDTSFGQGYEDKFQSYREHADAIKLRISQIIYRQIQQLEFGFIFTAATKSTLPSPSPSPVALVLAPNRHGTMEQLSSTVS